MGARSQLAGLAGAVVLGVLLVVGTGLVENMPVSALAAVVIVAVIGLFDVAAAGRLWRWRRTEFDSASPRSQASQCSACCGASASRSRYRC